MVRELQLLLYCSAASICVHFGGARAARVHGSFELHLTCATLFQIRLSRKLVLPTMLSTDRSDHGALPTTSAGSKKNLVRLHLTDTTQPHSRRAWP